MKTTLREDKEKEDGIICCLCSVSLDLGDTLTTASVRQFLCFKHQKVLKHKRNIQCNLRTYNAFYEKVKINLFIEIIPKQRVGEGDITLGVHLIQKASPV